MPVSHPINTLFYGLSRHVIQTWAEVVVTRGSSGEPKPNGKLAGELLLLNVERKIDRARSKTPAVNRYSFAGRTGSREGLLFGEQRGSSEAMRTSDSIRRRLYNQDLWPCAGAGAGAVMK